MAISAPFGDIISLVHAREEVQAMLAAAAACCADLNQLSIVPVEAGCKAGPDEGIEARDASDLPSSSRISARKRVAKAVTSRGVCLRNRII